MKWSKMECRRKKRGRRDLGGIKYAYACETSLYVDLGSSDRIGVIERWGSVGGGGSVYNAWVCYGINEWVDLGWFDFDPSVADGQMNAFSSLKVLKAFVEQQNELLNKAV